MELKEYETRIIEQLRYLAKDKAFQHLPEVLIKRLDILIDRDKSYNRTQSAYENLFSDGDAEAFINTRQTMKRIEDIVHNGNAHLECEIPLDIFEQKEILEDMANWIDIWMCCRKERRVNGFQKG